MVDSQNAERKNCKSSFANPMDSSTLGSSVFHYLPEFVQTPIHWVGDAIQPSHPLSPTSPPSSIFTSIRVFYSELVHHIRSKYWSYSFSISSFNEYSGLTTFRIDWFDLLAVQGALKSLFQHHSLKASILYLYGPGLTTVRDHREDHSLDYINICWQSDVCFSTHCLGLS